ncbi:hypothetical protein BJF78_06665 [Pseudonocardia sp. CNS-139]|nr:hypothetical protein BJF78_06665 [Pseudonocardia sp. CNS-139]
MTAAAVLPVPVPVRIAQAGRVGRAVGWAVVALAAAAFLVLLLAPGLLAPTDPVATGDDFLAPPSAAHWFGTDQLGRDTFSRVVHAPGPCWRRASAACCWPPSAAWRSGCWAESRRGSSARSSCAWWTSCSRCRC